MSVVYSMICLHMNLKSKTEQRDSDPFQQGTLQKFTLELLLITLEDDIKSMSTS